MSSPTCIHTSGLLDQDFMAKLCTAAREEGELESTKMGDLLLLLSCNGAKAQKMNGIEKPMGRVYECKTCNRRFPTFQALGGHRTSHLRPRIRRNRVEPPKKERPKQRVHECPVCGLEFPIGQALGGHMRRHKPTEAGEVHAEEKAGAGKILWLDLNLTPLENDLELTTLRLGLEIVEEASGCHRFL
ncbi:zinc finger protein ZAT11-like [Phoenix dactylifera]|uniref:Zinc finger protein ZAT11-like n=1 Tax=Phoenix dactylifera TaxID=42345 RepID=A0A8B7CBP4_PHODC|nr:zinc finger protein ZAT11-like [Phoenix dactylifera]